MTSGINMERFARGFTENLEAPVRQHLKNVYATVTIATACAAAGGFVHLYSSFAVSGLLTGLGALGVLLALIATPHDGKNQATRLSMLGVFAFLSGCNLGPLLTIAIMVNPAIVIEALLGTTVVFACFSLAALFAPRGHFLYLGGSLCAILSTVCLLSIVNLFVASRLLFQANLYISLAVMCGFVVYDTQLIIEKRRQGNTDYIMHGLELFIDFLAIFKRLLIILTDKACQKDSAEANQKRNNRRSN